ncbi:hypothetical protein CONCODRAFT_78096 [Conidiobolus coronatus NRRL 28638]|uniref:Chitin-binding type-4 domain-containing protein n=1 Tax=Conidiobolus coronatus (strain ATCC 28846 / CBS 209.66 / NRRL 28638) TaxID=796925 RepID=A0A137PA97_CONC2|nr:hypothetical protein CONCODRAFT_78096 [Conidiobolus coronatus NRRL 28638]|eukprot:KXN71933.1 hypothetical protein CONCODRAFT_78096 [Conidiobolus coronatus NRRL 28638]
MKFFLQTASLISLLGSITAHSNMHIPPTRGSQANAPNNANWGYCSKGWDCTTACESPKSQSQGSKGTIQRGQKFDITWLRQNHPGGFVRLAIVPFDQSDDSTAFDKNVVKYVCYETNCKESSQDPMLGYLNGPGTDPCTTDVTIPDWLPDGKVTLQWTWFGGGVLYANNNASFGQYVSCADLTVSGGNPYNATHSKPVFQGGDVANPGANVCRYWSTNSVHQCEKGAEQDSSCGFGPSKNGAPGDY